MKKQQPKQQSKSGNLRFQNMINSIVVTSDGYQKPVNRGKKLAKFVDVLYSVNVNSVGNVLNGICPVAQGITVNQRTGDTVFWRSLHINYTISTQNADIFNTARVVIFQWHPNTLLVAPVVTDILQTASLLSMYDWQFSNQFTILYDRVHIMSGSAGSPSDSGNQGYYGIVPFTKGFRPDSLYNPGMVNGSEQLFILVISDSLVAPFPIFNATTRVIYDD
jgi:hypothetical protein